MHTMRDAVNYCLPIIQNPLDGGSLNICNTGAPNTNAPSGNGYYGYIQHTEQRKQSKNEQGFERMETQSCQSGIVFNNSIPMDGDYTASVLNGGRHVNRKRAWEYGAETQIFKKRRENEFPQPTPSSTFLRNSPAVSKQPTHNVPDMPRCIMGHYI